MFINFYYCVYPPILSSIQWSAAALERTSQRQITHKSTVDKRRKAGRRRRRRRPSHVIAVNPSAVLSSGTGQVVDEERMVAEVYQESCPRSPFIRHTLFLGHYRKPPPPLTHSPSSSSSPSSAAYVSPPVDLLGKFKTHSERERSWVVGG